MLNSPESLWTHIGTSSVYTALFPIIIGGVLTYFKPWLDSEKEVRDRSNLLRQTLLEKVNKRLHYLICESFNSDLDELRGSPPKKPDIIADFTEVSARVGTSLEKINKLQARFRQCYGYIFATVAVGVVGLLVAITFESSRSYISALCYALIGSQLVAVFVIRHYGKRLEDQEENAQG